MSEFRVTRYTIRLEGRHRRLQKPFTAVFLSDLHGVCYGKDNCVLLQRIQEQNPAVVLVAGDMVTAGKTAELDAALSLMNELTRRYPVYYANGNHEYRLKYNTDFYGTCYAEYADRIRSMGVHLLENSRESVEIEKQPFSIWGLELPGAYFRRGRCTHLEAQTIRELLGEPEPDRFHILLAHHPAYFEAYDDWGADLTLSGHLHGGMVRLPWLGGVISPQFRLFPHYDRGLYTQNGHRLIVSAGLGSHTIPIRINNPPELVAIEFA
jgi:predicted MPP superfamily phosphohydrolase